MNIFNYITIGTAVISTILILMQTRGAGLGAGLGGGGEVHSERRGSDKTLHQITIMSVVFFGLSLILGILT
jgi:protein translocase SecG subunit